MQPRKDRPGAQTAAKPKDRRWLVTSPEYAADGPPHPEKAEGLPENPPPTPPLSTAPAEVPDEGANPWEVEILSTSPTKVPDPRWGDSNSTSKKP